MFKYLIGFADRIGVFKLKKLVFSKFNYKRTIYLNDKKITVPLIYGIGNISSEIWMLDLLRALLVETKGFFLDIGVNVGQTLIKLKSLDPEIHYVGFEPNPTCVFYVNELLRMNRFRNCTLVPVGLFSSDGLLPFEIYTDDPSDASASLMSEFRPGAEIRTSIFVPTFRYDSIASLLNIDCVGIVKIDVEGAEMEVLRSLSDMIRRDNPVILLEVVPTYDIPFRINRQKELENFFKSLNYKIYCIDKTDNDEFAALNYVESFSNIDDPTRSDYVVFPDGKIPDKLFVQPSDQ